MEQKFKVTGMHCKSCEILLTDSISEISGVRKVSADSGNGMVIVDMEAESVGNEVKKVIEKEGYKVV